MIDIYFDVLTDTPEGKDPDRYSQTLRSFHKQMWSKPLPDSSLFTLENRGYLTFVGNDTEIQLSSDAITHSYRSTRRMRPILDKVDPKLVDGLFEAGCTFPAYTLFPAKKMDGLPTINQARGTHRQIEDRFDLTLECIRRHYHAESSPLSDTLARYSNFFNLFQSFQGYIEFFLLQDLVDEQFERVEFYLPFENFQSPALPQTPDEYITYQAGVRRFIRSRGERIEGKALANQY